MKLKSNKTKKEIKQKKTEMRENTNIYFEMILAVIAIPLFSFLVLSVFSKNSPDFVNKILPIESDIKVFTEKAFYSAGENIDLFIKNDSGESIYFEPCQYLDKFEKMVDGGWIESSNYKGAKVYDESWFNKEKNFANCSISLPKDGAGIYRSVVTVYYKCEKPGESMCKDSDVFYSNKFEVKS
jgi:hypothetical protein